MAVQLKFDLPIARIILYAWVAFCAFLVFALSCARLNYTLNLDSGDSLNGGRRFYDPVVAELLFTSLIAMPWCGFMIYAIHKRYENRYVSTFLHELIGLSFIWLFWIVGTAIATQYWGNLGWCHHIEACRVLSALVAFAWLGWLGLTALLGICVLFSVANSAFGEPFHGRWDPRQTIYA